MARISISNSALQTIMLVVVVGTLLRLAIPNYLEIRERFADAIAQRDFHRVKHLLRNVSPEKGHGNMVFMLHQRSDEALPFPFSRAQLETGVKVNYAVRMKFPGYFDLTALEVVHEDGKHAFRLLEINEKGMEQIIRKRA